MLLKNKTKNEISTNFESFKQQILQSEKNPQQILDELIKSGKVSKQQLSNVMKLANTYKYLIDR